MNSEYENIGIEYDKSISRLWVDGKEHFGGDTSVMRSGKPLHIIAETPDGLRSYRVEPRSSSAYYLNAFYTLGIGLYLERDLPQRYTYPASTFLRYRNGDLEHWTNRPRNARTLGLNIALPYGNWFNVDRSKARASSGFVGGEVGPVYYFEENSNLSLTAGIATDFFAPMGPVTILGPWRSTSISYVDLRANHLSDQFEIGAGLSLAQIGWSLKQDTLSRPPIGDAQILAGLSLLTGMRLGNRGRLSLMYHPYFFGLDDGLRFTYQHHISFVWSTEMSIIDGED